MKGFYSLDLLEGQVFGAEMEDGSGSELAEEYEAESELEEGTGQLEEDLRSADWEEIREWELPEELNDPQPVSLLLTIDSETQMECMVTAVFLDQEKEYIALKLPEGEIQIMELGQRADGEIDLISVEREEEQERVISRYLELMGQEESETYDNGEEWSDTQEINGAESK